VQTRDGLDAKLGVVHYERFTNEERRDGFVRHPIHATVEEAAHLRDVAEDGESPATPVIVVAAVLVFVVPLVAVLTLLAFGIAHFA
jgi:hypothetical protein